MASKKHRPTVVVMVDNKRRDLLGAAFLAHQLERLGIDCRLEPLEATFAVLGAHQPDMIVFNHLSATHLSAYTQKLRRLGVLVGLMPNEGLGYTRTAQDLVTLKAHKESHVDVYFCWNEPSAEAVRRNAAENVRRVEVVGVPRFDFYHHPWSRYFLDADKARKPGERQRILVCTNFVFADYADKPEAAEALFGNWATYVPGLADFRTAMEISLRNRNRLPEFLAPILAADRWDVILRPHPAESIATYRAMVDAFPEALRRNVRLSTGDSITPMILDCDLEISMDSCTTALESWLSGKPTLELEMERHPILTQDLLLPLNVQVSDPARIVEEVEKALADPTQPEKAAVRQAHIDTWCRYPEGGATMRMAEIIRDAIVARGPLPRFAAGLEVGDRRRGMKLKMLQALNKPYNWQPQMYFRRLLDQDGAYLRWKDQEKAIRPSDVAAVHRRMKTAFHGV